MATPKHVPILLLATSLLLAAATACSGGGSAPPATQAPQKPASAAATAPAGTTAPTTAAAPSATKPAATGGEIRFGAGLNITGPTASQGALFRKAIDLAVNQINSAGGINGKKINMMIEDNQSTNPGALAALNKNIENDNVLVEVGPVLSTQVQAISDADKQAGVPMATGGTAVKNTHMGNPWLFRMRPDDSVAAAAMVQYIKDDMKLTKVGIVHDSDAFGTGGAQLVEQYSKDNGLTVVRDESYTADSKDYTAQLLALKNAGAEVMVVYATRPEDAALIERQYHDLGAPYKYMGSPSSAEADTLALSKDSANGLYAVVDFMLGTTDQSKAYVDAYTKAYNSQPDALSAWNYDAVQLFANAIKSVGEDRSAIMKYILGTHGWQGVCGTYDFTPNGDGLHSNTVVQIGQGGSLKQLKVVTVKPQQ
jgi:branched-chain amino acid transport system substrate-binding protein